MQVPPGPIYLSGPGLRCRLILPLIGPDWQLRQMLIVALLPVSNY